MQTQTQPIKVVQPGEGNHLWVLNIYQTHKLTGDDTNGALFIWEDRVPPEGGPPCSRLSTTAAPCSATRS